MRTVKMTGTDMVVSQLALGTAQFGTGLEKEKAFEQMDAYVDFGGNLIDTAHAYGNWEPGLDSPSEETIGKWLKQSGKRDKVYISTKGGDNENRKDTGSNLSREVLEEDLTGSLRKLGVDYIDLYFMHKDDPTIPAEEVLGFLEEKVKEGKIRYYGCSNWSLSRIKEAQEAAEKNGYKGFVCDQVLGSLADVNMETLPKGNVAMDKPLRAYHEETQLSFMAYMSLARGYLMCRMSGSPISQETLENYTAPSNDRIVEKLKEIVSDEYTTLDFCYQYLIQLKFPSVPISGFSSLSQMKEAVDAVNKDMPADLLAQVADLKELQ